MNEGIEQKLILGRAASLLVDVILRESSKEFLTSFAKRFVEDRKGDSCIGLSVGGTRFRMVKIPLEDLTQ